MVIFFPFVSCDEVIQLKANYIQIITDFIQVYKKVSFDLLVLGSIQHRVIWQDPFDFWLDIWGQLCAIQWGKYYVFPITVINPNSFSLIISASLDIKKFVNLVKKQEQKYLTLSSVNFIRDSTCAKHAGFICDYDNNWLTKSPLICSGNFSFTNAIIIISYVPVKVHQKSYDYNPQELFWNTFEIIS